jgi:hypothetical protein
MGISVWWIVTLTILNTVGQAMENISISKQCRMLFYPLGRVGPSVLGAWRGASGVPRQCASMTLRRVGAPACDSRFRFGWYLPWYSCQCGGRARLSVAVCVLFGAVWVWSRLAVRVGVP